MNISISGSHCTGKTVLARAIQRALCPALGRDLVVIGEVARVVIAKGFPLNREASVDSYINYVLEQLRAERTAGGVHVISDRSLVDLLAYMRANASPYIPDYLLAMVEEVIWLERDYYDLYCYTPIEFDLVLDDVRPADVEYRELVDRSLRSVLLEYRLNVVALTGNVEERCRKVCGMLMGS